MRNSEQICVSTCCGYHKEILENKEPDNFVKDGTEADFIASEPFF